MAKNAAGHVLEASSPRPRMLSGLSKTISYNTGIYADLHFHFWGLQRRCDRMLMCGYSWSSYAISLQLGGWLNRAPNHRLVLLQAAFPELVDHSLVIAAGQRHWLSARKLVVLPHWLSDASLLGHQ